MIRRPSGDVVTNVGYQPVGTNPRTLLSPRFSPSTTATELLSALATYSRSPSGDSAREFGVLPAGAFGLSAVLMTSSRSRVFRSNAMTLLVWPQETKRRPSLLRARSFGCGSVDNVA